MSRQGPRPLLVSIVVGRVGHGQSVIDDLRNRVEASVDPSDWEVEFIAVCVGGYFPRHEESPVDWQVRLPADTGGILDAGFRRLAVKPGPVGAVGRLVRDNLESRRVASVLSRNSELLNKIRHSAVVVSADPSTSRVVWQLRKSTSAHLVYGPAAMLHAIRLVTQG